MSCNSYYLRRTLVQIIAVTIAAFFIFGISGSIAVDGNNDNETATLTSTTTTTTTTPTTTLKSPYKIVIDGGSTGSRLHIFEFIQNPQTSKTYIERRGSTKVNIPLSTFAFSQQPNEEDDNNIKNSNTNNQNHSDDAALHLLPLFQFASEIIPSEYHSTTHVSLQATAGMRLINIEEQNALYDTIHEQLMDHEEFVFDSFRRSDVRTLDGVLEGLYGVIAVNYLKGVVDVNLEYNNSNVDSDHDGHDVEEKESSSTREQKVCMNDDMNSASNAPFGALDLGGASMQIVFLPSKATENVNESNTCLSSSNTEEVQYKLPSHEFYSTSYLSYGSDQFRERLWDLWIIETQQGNGKEINTMKAMIENPCSFKGHEIEWNGYILYGTGNAKQCTNEINRLIPHHEEIDHDNDEYIVGGIQHPEIRGEFYAMSLFFFVMDCVREYTQDEILSKAWPNPSLHELSMAVESFCSKHWVDDLLNDHGLDRHRFTQGNRLSERCFESAYIVALLRDGFGFDVHARDITYSFLVNDSEVEWSLGMAISLYAEDGQTVGASPLGSSHTHSEGEEKEDGDEDLKEPQAQSCEENSTDCQQGIASDNNDTNGRTLNEEEDVLNHIIHNDSIWSEDSLI